MAFGNPESRNAGSFSGTLEKRLQTYADGHERFARLNVSFDGFDISAFSDSGKTMAEMAHARENQFLASEVDLSASYQ